MLSGGLFEGDFGSGGGGAVVIVPVITPCFRGKVFVANETGGPSTPAGVELSRLNLTEDYFRSISKPAFKPLVAGDTWHPRFQVRDAFNDAVDLTGTTIKMLIKAHLADADVNALFMRSTGGTPSIFVDADQANEDTTNNTGRGWFEVHFDPADESALLAIVGLWFYDIRIEFIDNSVSTYAKGSIEILRPVTQSIP